MFERGRSVKVDAKMPQFYDTVRIPVFDASTGLKGAKKKIDPILL